MTYRRRATPLHAARAAAAGAYLVALALTAVLFHHPVVLGAVMLALAGAAVGASSGRMIARAALWALPFAVLMAAINALASRNGLTVIARLGDWGPLGQVDVTLEALVYGALIGVQAAALIVCFALWSVAVDPDEVLRGFRRVSFHSALTAALSTRLFWILWRDGARMAEALRSRPGAPPGRLALLRAVTAGTLERAVDTAAALELRGYAGAHRPPRARRARSRHDVSFAAAACALAALAIGARVAGVAGWGAYPTLHAEHGAGQWALAAAIVVVAWLPFADRRGVA
jgi:energy-coupling factor transport system permease protein